MKILNWHNWGIKTRMSVITLIPLAMIISVIFWSYLSRLTEIQEDLEERSNIIASTLAHGSQYGMISGNFAYLERTIKGLLQTDKSIYRIEILDPNKKSLVNLLDKNQASNKMQIFEMPIRQELVQFNPFGQDNPSYSATVDHQPDTHIEKVVGFVRLTMSPSSMLEGKRKRIFIGTSIASIFLLLSILVGIFLARSLTKPLAATISALRRIREGQYEIPLTVTTGGEIGDLQTTIIDMAESLYQLKQNLEGKVLTRTQALEEARDEALKAGAEKRKLIQQVNSAVEEERKNIAIELHDQLNASLIVARLQSPHILDLINKEQATPTTEAVKNKAQFIIQLTGEVYTLCRNIVRRLRPEVIDMLGLQGAVEEMVNYYDEIHPDCQFAFQTKGDFSDLDGGLSITAYRLIQEALSNVVKHSEASEASVHLKFIEEIKTLRIEINDNGKGFDLNTMEPGIGLIGMRERVYSLEGQIKIHSALNTGTQIIIDLPISNVPAQI